MIKKSIILQSLSVFLLIIWFSQISLRPIWAASSVPWGGFYVPIDQAIYYKMTGIITSNHANAVSILKTAKANNIKVIITLNPVAECDFYNSSNHSLLNFNDALSAQNTAISNLLDQFTDEPAGQKLADYVNSGTLAAIRIFDEVDYAGSCGNDYGIPITQNTCGTGTTLTTRTQNGLPLGTGLPGNADYSPGFADLIYELKKKLPDNLVIGSTSSPGYMVKVAQRINELRQNNGLTPLPAKNILAYSGIQCRQGSASIGCPHYYAPAKDHFECQATKIPGMDMIFYLANRSAAYETDNYTWWQDYIGICQAKGLDFISSWSWLSPSTPIPPPNSPIAGNFQYRIQQLADGQVPGLALNAVQNACNQFSAPTPTPSSCPLASSGDFNCDGKINESDLNTLLGKWITGENDITEDGKVNESDLNKLLGNWKTN